MIKQFQKFLYREIPLTMDMGLIITSFSNSELQLKAPLANNINDKGSAFGGSSSALMIIAAWSLIKLNCNKYNIQADIVIHKNETIWQKALYKDLIINAKFALKYDFKKIEMKLSSNKHQRIECIIEIADPDLNIFSTMNAKYVIIPKIHKESNS